MGAKKINIYVTVKSLAKKKAYIDKIRIEISQKPNSLRELITQIVSNNVKDFNDKKVEMQLCNYISKDDIELQSKSGKVGFNTKYNDKQADEKEAVDIAITAFEDGLYRIFIDDEEVDQLDAQLSCRNDAEVAFVKLTMLAGRLW